MKWNARKWTDEIFSLQRTQKICPEITWRMGARENRNVVKHFGGNLLSPALITISSLSASRRKIGILRNFHFSHIHNRDQYLKLVGNGKVDFFEQMESSAACTMRFVPFLTHCGLHPHSIISFLIYPESRWTEHAACAWIKWGQIHPENVQRRDQEIYKRNFVVLCIVESARIQ